MMEENEVGESDDYEMRLEMQYSHDITVSNTMLDDNNVILYVYGISGSNVINVIVIIKYFLNTT